MKQIYILLIALLMGLSANAERSGTCGPNLKWYLNNDGVLTITGKRKCMIIQTTTTETEYHGGTILRKLNEL